MGGRPRTVAEKLDHLFRTVRGPRGEYTAEEVSAGIRARGGPTISASYLWQLRRGSKDNPTKKHIEALAGFFGVPAAYFFNDEVAERVEAELDLAVAMRDAGVRHLALRSAGLSVESLRVVQELVERTRQLEEQRRSSRPTDAGGGTQTEPGRPEEPPAPSSG